MNPIVTCYCRARLLATLAGCCLAIAALARPSKAPDTFPTFAEVGREAAATLGQSALQSAFGSGRLTGLTP
jgi:hypothetical protein